MSATRRAFGAAVSGLRRADHSKVPRISFASAGHICGAGRRSSSSTFLLKRRIVSPLQDAVFQVDRALTARNGRPEPHVVMLEGVSGSGKYAIVERLARQGLCVAKVPHFLQFVNDVLARRHAGNSSSNSSSSSSSSSDGAPPAPLTHDELLDAEEAYEDAFYRGLKQAWSKDVFAARGKVIFVVHHPSICAAMAARCRPGVTAREADERLLAARAQLEHDRRSYNASLVRVHNDVAICQQRLQLRLFQSSPLEQFVRSSVFGDDDEARLAGLHQQYARDDLLPFDASIDGTSTKQAVLRLLSALDISNDLLKERGAAAAH